MSAHQSIAFRLLKVNQLVYRYPALSQLRVTPGSGIYLLGE